jgi:hypothetical protein
MRRHVFVDTSEFVAANFDFDGGRLAALLSRVDQGQVILSMSSIVQREVRARIKREMHQAQSSLERTRNEARILRNLQSSLSASLYEDSDFKALTERKLTQFDDFIENAKVQLVGLQDVDCEAVLDLYFREEAPFNSVKKKHEFPDAFSLAAISGWAQSESTDVLVASSDADIEAGVSSFPNLVFEGNLQRLLEKVALEFDILAPEAVRALASLLPLLREDLFSGLSIVKPRMTNWVGKASLIGAVGADIDPTLLRVSKQPDGRARAEFDAIATGSFNVLFEYHDLNDVRVSNDNEFGLEFPTRTISEVRDHIWQADITVDFDPAHPAEEVFYTANWRIPDEIDMPFAEPRSNR